LHGWYQCRVSDSHKTDESSNGHSSVVANNLHTLGRSGHGSNTNVPSLRWCIWRGTKCGVVDVEIFFVVKKQVIASNPKEVALDDDLGEDHVGLFNLYCPNDISTIMNIWKWPFS
jgi:hypothetical protein